jgi:hypothetical protein
MNRALFIALIAVALPAAVPPNPIADAAPFIGTPTNG